MNLKISNYKSLKDLNINIDDNKINFVFGISGGGKSSIGGALTKKDLTENITINKIYEDTKIKLPIVPNNDYYNIDMNKLSMFEKILFYRDFVSDATIKNSYNNIVHMNESLQICLNPYKFNYFSPFVFDDLLQRN